MEELITPSEKRIINRKKGEIYDYISYSNAFVPYQGWKIHISANLIDYQSILDWKIYNYIS